MMPSGIIWALGTFFKYISSFFTIYLLIISPTVTRAQRRPTKANAGQRRSTKAHSSQRRPTKANAGQRRPTAPNDGQRRPTQAHARPTAPNDGQRRPTQALRHNKQGSR